MIGARPRVSVMQSRKISNVSLSAFALSECWRSCWKIPGEQALPLSSRKAALPRKRDVRSCHLPQLTQPQRCLSDFYCKCHQGTPPQSAKACLAQTADPMVKLLWYYRIKCSSIKKHNSRNSAWHFFYFCLPDRTILLSFFPHPLFCWFS